MKWYVIVGFWMIGLGCGKNPYSFTSFNAKENSNNKAQVEDETPLPSSCHVKTLEEGALIYCDDGSSALIYHGEDGTPLAQEPYELVEVIDPCEDHHLDEVLLRFANGQILAHYSAGNKQFFTLLTPGTYITTDGTQCRFEITEDGEVVDLN